MIRIWQSYSCNNSASYRLVARFADAEHAAEVGTELEAFLHAHAAEVDANPVDEEAITQAQLALGEKYGFTWTHMLSWGGALIEDPPKVVLVGEVMIVHHHYCGGFGDLLAYVEARGGTVDYQPGARVELTLLFRLPPGDDLDGELAGLFDQLAPREELHAIHTPWRTNHIVRGDVAAFRDRDMFGLHLPIVPRDLGNLRSWLTERGIEKPVLRIGELDDLALLRTIAAARCTACGGPLDYLDPRLHDIEMPQLVCKPCGGLYDLGAFR